MASISGFTAKSRAVAPAGGCVVLVTCMTTMARAVEREPMSQRRESRCVGDEMPATKSLVMVMPVRALRK